MGNKAADVACAKLGFQYVTAFVSADPTQTTPELPHRGPHGGQRAQNDSEKPYTGVKKPHGSEKASYR